MFAGDESDGIDQQSWWTEQLGAWLTTQLARLPQAHPWFLTVRSPGGPWSSALHAS